MKFWPTGLVECRSDARYGLVECRAKVFGCDLMELQTRDCPDLRSWSPSRLSAFPAIPFGCGPCSLGLGFVRFAKIDRHAPTTCMI